MDESTRALLEKEAAKVRETVLARRRISCRWWGCRCPKRQDRRVYFSESKPRHRSLSPRTSGLTHCTKPTYDLLFEEKNDCFQIGNEWQALSIIHSCFKCRSFVDEVYATLPREVREMVWYYLFQSEDKRVKQIDQTLTETVLHAKYCEEPSEGPWFIQACFVGPNVRTEMLELRYRKIFSTFRYTGRGVYALPDFATADAYHTGLKPLQFVRRLELDWSVVEYNVHRLRDPEYWPTSIEQPSWKACFDALRQVRYKSSFRFNLRIRELGPQRSGKHFGHLLETFRPVYEELIAAGSTIAITSLRQWTKEKDMELDATDFYKMDKEEWYKRFLTHSIKWDIIAMDDRRANAGEAAVEDWHAEGDKEFDNMIERGMIRY
jgi:hypothetical protein